MPKKYPTFSGRRLSQDEKELRGFIALLRSLSVMSYLEIGAREGDTFYEIMTALPPGSRGVAVDFPGQAWGRLNSGAQLKKACAVLGANYKTAIVIGDSHSTAVRSQVEKLGPYDAVFIDADHRYEAVKADFEAYWPMAKKVIAFHDIDGTGQKSKNDCFVEVPKLWMEIKQRHFWKEFITPGSRMGIGVLFL